MFGPAGRPYDKVDIVNFFLVPVDSYDKRSGLERAL